MRHDDIVSAIARAIEYGGIGVILAGGLLASLAALARFARRRSFHDAYRDYRADLGRAILLGLEFLVAADIVGTIAVEPSFRSLGILALIVVIRTFLSITLELEVSGRWPWQHATERVARDRAETD